MGNVLGTTRVFNHHVHTAYYWLAILDMVLFIGACYLATWLYFLSAPALLPDYINALPLKAALFGGMTTLAMFSLGMYQPRLREGPNGIILRTAGAVLMMTVGMAVIYFFLPGTQLWRGMFVYAAVIAFTSALITRLVFINTVELEQFKRKVLVLGSGQRAANIAARMRRNSDRRGFRIFGYVRFPEEESAVESPRIFSLDQPLSAYVREHNIQQIIVALDENSTELPAEELIRCRTMGVEVMSIIDFFEQEAGKVLVNEAPAEWFIFADGFKRKDIGSWVKRVFDIAAGFLLLTMTWPLMLLTVLAIKLEDGWKAPVIFRQKRVGLNGRVFEVMKFRSMTVNAESDGKARWATANDARVTRVGHCIRKLRIDELPQIFNVMMGDMALVGPRPERPEFVRELSEQIPFFDKRHCVKPGITGWAQLNYPYGASVQDSMHKLEYDLYYVKNQSLFLDFLVLMQTAEVILFGKGAR
ncbi:sugar transferase [Kineobactrum sediminis]|uniref:Sugar transferase n=1 Tax=Kineobactrum sediminis TaxID=1905677 RepID=A0A2N5XZN2_9GAMM|nr:sugar transferase [Kineobactrum sediminis]